MLDCAVVYILLIIEHNGDVSSENASWNNAVTHGRTGAVNNIQGVSEIGGHVLDLLDLAE